VVAADPLILPKALKVPGKALHDRNNGCAGAKFASRSPVSAASVLFQVLSPYFLTDQICNDPPKHRRAWFTRKLGISFILATAGH